LDVAPSAAGSVGEDAAGSHRQALVRGYAEAVEAIEALGATGRFRLEMHGEDPLLGPRDRALLYLEVRSK